MIALLVIVRRSFSDEVLRELVITGMVSGGRSRYRDHPEPLEQFVEESRACARDLVREAFAAEAAVAPCEQLAE